MAKYIDSILEKSDELISAIKDSKDYKRYINLKEIIRKDEEIMGLIDEVKTYQKMIIKLNDVEQTRLLEQKINEILEKLDTIPIYVEYNYLQTDLNEMFQIIKNTIEKCLYNITN